MDVPEHVDQPPGLRARAQRWRSGALTCVAPTNASGSYTSTSVGAMLKSPATITGITVGGDGIEVRGQPVEPRQLVLVVVGVERPAVRHVDVDDGDPVARGGHQPGLGVGLVAVGEAERHVVEARRDRIATPFHRPSPWWADS